MAIEYLWQYYHEIRSANRHHGGMEGFHSITNTEMKAWMENMQMPLAPWEQRVIFALDAVRFESLQDDFTYVDVDTPVRLSLVERKPELRFMM